MQRDRPLRDPFAADNDDASSSGAGRPPPRRLPRSTQQAPLRNVDEPPSSALFPPRGVPQITTGAPRYIGSLGRTQSANTTEGGEGSGMSGTRAPARQSLGLSLGLPRTRMAVSQSGSRDVQSAQGPEIPGAAKRADEAVRNTDSDALLSRLSALKLGYLPAEPFTQEFSSNSSSNKEQGQSRPGFGGSPFSRPHQPDTPARRSPLINIGTYLRCSTIDNEVEAFLKEGDGAKQIISIGAGSDSRYWRIMSDPNLANQLHTYVEIDFPDNTSHKLSRILRSNTLRSPLDDEFVVHGIPINDLSPSHAAQLGTNASSESSSQVLHSSKYTLLAADVRRLHPDTPAAERIEPDDLFSNHSSGLKHELPTLVLFECVLAYIAPTSADWLIRLLGDRFAHVQALSYDIALAGDADNAPSVGTQSSNTTSQPAIPPSRFGKVMLQNLEMRNLSLSGAKAYPTIETQSQRFVQAWSSTENKDDVEASGRSLFSIWSALDAAQKQRLSRLEGLDEVEEIDMLLKHYCIVQARRRKS